jgi:hypothetical protein
MYDKIFISYAKEDYPFAARLYEFLNENNFNPWLDKKEILPGQDWNFIINKALREANYIILLLSNVSVQKRGYVQREFKTALNFVEEKLDDDIYLILIKIDDCVVPITLSKFQWIKYDDDSCFETILRSLNLQREKYIDDERKQIAAKELFEYQELEENFEYGNSIKFFIRTKYCQFIDVSNRNLAELNAIIKGKQAEYIAESRKNFYTITGDLLNLDFESPGWSFEVSYSPNLITKLLISISENVYNFSGGAHGSGYINGLNFHLNPFFIVTLEELFEYEDHDPVLNFFSTFCYEELRKRHNEWIQPDEEEIALQTPNNLFYEGSLDPKWENFSAFLISKSSIEMIFNTYSVSAYAFGVQIIPIPYEKILTVLSKPENLRSLINKLE